MAILKEHFKFLASKIRAHVLSYQRDKFSMMKEETRH